MIAAKYLGVTAALVFGVAFEVSAQPPGNAGEPTGVAEAEAEPEPALESEPDVEASLPSPARRVWDAIGLRVSGYLQAQYTHSQLSEDSIGADGLPMNQDRFFIRRGRIRIDRTWDYASLAFELDASNTRAPFVGFRRAEMSYLYPSSRPGAPPLVMITAGLSEVPFGFEVRQGPRVRWFMERSFGSLAFQRGEPDLGVRVSGGVGAFRYAVAVVNGYPLDDRSGGSSLVLTQAKDLVGRVGMENLDGERFRYRVGASFYAGHGLHPGTAPTKPTLLWRDLNEDGLVQTVEITGVAGRAGSPSVGFRRWAMNVDVGFDVHSPLGWTQVYGEVTLASNYDRSYQPADPVAQGYDLRELAWYVALVQDVLDYGVVGFRFDSYDPDSNLLESRRGLPVAYDATVRTFSPMIGAQIPGRGRIVLQYDHVRDHLGRSAAGFPIDLRNDQFLARMQMEF